MDICLWYLDSGCSRHMTGDRSLFKVFESKKGGNVTSDDGSKSQIKGKGTSLAHSCTSFRLFDYHPNFLLILEQMPLNVVVKLWYVNILMGGVEDLIWTDC